MATNVVTVTVSMDEIMDAVKRVYGIIGARIQQAVDEAIGVCSGPQQIAEEVTKIIHPFPSPSTKWSRGRGKKAKVAAAVGCTATKEGDVSSRLMGSADDEQPKRKGAAGGKMGVCIDCGESYLKTSNVQKRCPACRQLKKIGAPSAPIGCEAAAESTRLQRIKMLDKKLDTIGG